MHGKRVAWELARYQLAQGCRVLAVSLAPPPDGPIGEDFRALGATTQTVPTRGGLDLSLPLRLARLLLNPHYR